MKKTRRTFMGTLLFVLGLGTAAMAQDSAAEVQGLVTQKAHSNNVPAALAHAVIEVESSYNPKAYNQGSYGIGQVRCETARSLGFRGPCNGLYNAEVNLEYSMQYLRAALDVASGNWCHAVTLYNEGIFSPRISGRYCRKVYSRIPQDQIPEDQALPPQPKSTKKQSKG